MKTRSRVAVLLLVAVLLAASCGRPGAANTATLKVRKGPFEIVIPAFGELQAAKSTPIVVSPSSRFSIMSIGWMAPEYTMVKSGDVVIRLASADLPDQLRSEKAELAKVELEITQKEKQLDKEKNDLTGQISVTAVQRELADVYAARDETIFPRNKIIEDAIDLNYQNIRERHYEDQRAQLEKRTKAELQLLQSKARAHQVKIKQFEDQLNNLDIRAPNDGMFIINRMWNGERYRVGMNAFPGMKLGALPDLSVMEAKIFVLESEASGLKENLPVSLRLDYEPGRIFTGKIVGLDTIAKPLSEDTPLKYFETRVALDSTDPRLMKPGIQVKATIFAEKLSDVIAVPNQALIYEQEKPFIMVKRSSRSVKRPVETGARSLTLTVITKGLAAGDIILLAGPEAAAKGGKPS